jgi:TonB family protein
MRLAALALISASLLFAQSPSVAETDLPVVVTFVAPAYPRAAKDRRIFGKTVTRVTINRDGTVAEVKTISAHPVFESYVLETLKQWRFKPSDREQTL